MTTKTVATAQENTFYKLSKLLTRAEFVNVIDTDGMFITENIDPVDKLVYTYMYDQFCMLKADGKKFFQMQETIAFGIGVSSRTVRRSINKLNTLGFIKTETNNTKDKRRNSYVVVDFTSIERLELCNASANKFDSNIPVVFWQSKKQDIKVLEQQPTKHVVYKEETRYTGFDFDEEPPF